jgi:sec-independent protein translocase protein TatA
VKASLAARLRGSGGFDAGILGLVGPFGWQEMLIVLVILLLLFGARRLPEMGRSLGRGMREFKDAVTGKDEDEERAELPPPAPPAEPASQPKSEQVRH